MSSVFASVSSCLMCLISESLKSVALSLGSGVCHLAVADIVSHYFCKNFNRLKGYFNIFKDIFTIFFNYFKLMLKINDNYSFMLTGRKTKTVFQSCLVSSVPKLIHLFIVSKSFEVFTKGSKHHSQEHFYSFNRCWCCRALHKKSIKNSSKMLTDQYRCCFISLCSTYTMLSYSFNDTIRGYQSLLQL